MKKIGDANMKRQAIILRTGSWMAILIAVLACGQEAPPQPQSQEVRERIPVEQAAPPAPAQEGATSPAEPAGPVQARDRVQAEAAAAGDQAEAATAAEPERTLNEEIETAEPSELIRESLEMAGSYDPTGRFDPFEPLFKPEPEVQVVAASGERRERRGPPTPLERIALSQLKVTAIIRAPSGNRAMVVDATGKGYVVSRGTYIGLNSGRVIDIVADRIVVEEEIETIMGELKIQIAELKLQKPPGEL